jgi:hypothetical protein
MKTLLLSTIFLLGTFFSYAQIDTCDVAGSDGTITVCPDSAFNLFSGLVGFHDSTGVWIDFIGTSVPEYYPNGLSISGQYFFTYLNQHPGCPNADTSYVIVIVLPSGASCPTANISEDSMNGLSIYPNPANDFVTISNEGPHQDLRYTLFSLDGVKIEEATLSETSTQKISVAALKSGIYYFHVRNDEIRSVYRILKE